MNQKGFSLAELMTAIAITAILVGIATMNFASWREKGDIETQTREIYADLLKVRSEALFRQNARAVQLGTTSFRAYPSTDVSAVPVLTQSPLKKTITYSADTVYFDGNGVASTTLTGAGAPIAICVGSAGNSAGIDSVVINSTTILLGKLSSTGACTYANVTAK